MKPQPNIVQGVGFSLTICFLLIQSKAVAGNSCHVVLAQSSIPNAGFGVYSLRDYDLGDPIGHASIAIPWIDNIHIFGDRNTSSTTGQPHGESLWNHFLIDASGIGGFGEAQNVSMFLPGLPSLVQHHSYLENIMISGMKLMGSSQRVDIMAGAETAYHSVQLIAKRRIQKGEELFLFPPSRKHSEFSSPHPKKEAYEMAEELVQKLKEYAAMEQTKSITSAQWTDLLYRIRMDVMEDSATAKLLPRSLYELELAFQKGLARSKLIDRNIDWILEHGTCLDSIRQGSVEETKESVHPRSFGAFATLKLPEGSVISQTPMIPVHRDVMLMHSSHNNTRQLLWNYCLGHRQGTILLCPTTAAAMMNHNSKAPNVRLRWMEPNRLLHGSLEEFLATVKLNDMLVMEYVALRDIAEGEELVIDYGSEWGNAYQSHLRDNHHSARVLPLLTDYEKQIQRDPLLLLSENLPSALATECQLYPLLKPDAQLDDWQDFFTVHRDSWPLDLQKLYPKDDQFASWYPCQAVDVDPSTSSYSVLIFSQHLHNEKVLRRFRGFPQEYIRLVNERHHSDQHSPWAFRHYISIPDDIFPLRWRNDYKLASSWKLGVVEDTYLTDRTKLEEQQQIYEKALRQVDCGLYMSLSNIPNSGYGMYAGADVPFSQLIVGSTIPEVPVDNYEESHWPGTEYVWNSYGLVENQESTPVLRGLFGSIANSHNGVINMMSPKIQYSPYDPMVDRRKDAGAGAFSPYVENTFLSVYPVKAGEELFVTYGEHWFRNRKEYATVPLMEHFRRADDILASLLSMMTLEGSSLFDANIPFYANQDKFNVSYHGELEDAIAFCKIDEIEGQIDTSGASEVIKLSRKNDRTNRMPASIVARMDPKDIPHESYLGINNDAKEFEFADTISGGQLPCRVIGSDSTIGLLDVIVFFSNYDKRELLRYESFDADRLTFQIPPEKDGLSSLLNLLRNHFFKELDDEGMTTESFLRFRTALSNIDSVGDITAVLHRNGTAMATTKRRSKEWLEENGICLDHIFVKRSSIASAGNGAFARRHLKKNTVIIGSPMLAVSRDHKLLTMAGNSSSKSLIFNYHYGHKASSVLFFPNSHAIAINHNSKSMPSDGKPANARVQFSIKDKKSRYLVHRQLEDIVSEKYSSLVMEVVATRDIAPDEEIFIDYGEEWEAAWKEHVKGWTDPCLNVKPPCFKSSMSIWKMNQDKANQQYHAWSEDHLSYCTMPKGPQNNKNTKRVALNRGDSYVGVSWNHDGFQLESYQDNSGVQVFPCLVIGFDTTNSTFEVALFDKRSSNDSISVLRHCKHFSGGGLSFRPRQFKGDTMNPLAFRHEIGIPEDAFPEHWKDLEA